jgi:hypothetical protein
MRAGYHAIASCIRFVCCLAHKEFVGLEGSSSWISRVKVLDAALGIVIGPENLAELVSVSIMQTAVPKYL